MAETKTVLRRYTDEIQTGKFKVNDNVGLTTVKQLEISEIKDGAGKYGKRAFNVKVSAEHPIFSNISFAFVYTPQDKHTHDFRNKNGDHFCMGTAPMGEIKDVVMGALAHESYAFQISLVRTTWIHAENGPENGQYLLWHIQYYGRYSPRSIWRLPLKCEKEKLWATDPKKKKELCNACLGSRCEHLGYKCIKCGNITSRQCPVCKSPVCDNHSHCANGHYNLTSEGMFEGHCEQCRRKMPLGEKVCKTCGCKNYRKY
jgi:hypothetical protein